MSNDSSSTNGRASDPAGFEIHHVDVPANRFTIISNDMLRGKQLEQLSSLERVILFHFFSLDTGMRMTRGHIDNSVKEGRDAVTRALAGLEQKGYLRRTRMRQSGGRWLWRWLITGDPINHPLDPPQTILPTVPPSPENPSMDVTCENTVSSQVAPSTGKPSTENLSIFEDRSSKTEDEDFSLQAQPSVDIASAEGSALAEPGERNANPEHPNPCRLAGLSDEHKVQRLCGMLVSDLTRAGLEPSEDYRRDVGNALYRRIADGCTNRQLIDMVRREATNVVTVEARKDTTTPRGDAELAEFLNAYPRQASEDRAGRVRDAWDTAFRNGATATGLVHAARAYAAEVHAEGRRSCPYPDTWLTQVQWLRGRIVR